MSSSDWVRAELDEHQRQRQLADARTEVHGRAKQPSISRREVLLLPCIAPPPLLSLTEAILSELREAGR